MNEWSFSGLNPGVKAPATVDEFSRYDALRTGLTFREVRLMLGGRRFITRHTVLGKWHEIKLALWSEMEGGD